MKYKVILRDVCDGTIVKDIEKVVDFEGTADELRNHGHIIQVLGVVEEEKQVEVKTEKKDKTAKEIKE